MDDNSENDSGKVYDFKDPKTSGVVSVTKNWDDSSSNDKRTVPDVSISTVDPSKLNRTYTITFHGNGLKFADGSEENTVIYNGSGQIISGTYNIPIGAFVEWCFDTAFKYKAIFNDNGTLTSSFLNSIDHTSIDLYAKEKTFVLKKGAEFYKLIPSTATSVVFTDEITPASATLIDVDADGDGGVVAWMDGTTLKVSTQIKGLKMQANPYSSYMFDNKRNLKNIDLTMLDTQNVTSMYSMFRYCIGLTALDLSHLDTRNVTDMNAMFFYCCKLTTLDLSHLDTRNVTDMSSMFFYCSGLTTLDLSPLDTRNVINMGDMFSKCNRLTALDLSPLDTRNVTNMGDMFSGCSSLTNLNLTALDTSKVTDMDSMFAGCRSLVSLDLSPLDTGNVTSMRYMFDGCSGLTSLDLTPFDTSKVTNMDYMFRNCNSLTSLNLTSINTNKVKTMLLTFYSCNDLTSLSLGKTFKFVGTRYYLPAGTWYSSNGTAYTSDGTTCTIPNNKADTYTRR